MPLRKIHLIVGLIFILVFLATGMYMHFFLNHLQGMEGGKRMLFRSGHMYILLAAVANVMYGYNWSPAAGRRLRILHGLVSAALLMSPVLFTIGFFYEPYLENFERPFSRLPLYLMFILSILLGIAGMKRKTGSDEN